METLGFPMKLTSFPPMEMTWKLHCFYLVVSHHGKDIISNNRNNKANFKLHFKQVMETVWFPCGHHLVSMWRPLSLHMDTMVSMWFLCGHNMVIMWTPCVSRWIPCGFHVNTTWFPCFYVVTIISSLYR